jgi:hypothetical protein
MATNWLSTANANKLSEPIQRGIVNMEFKDALAFAAPWRGRVIWESFIGHIFLECFSGRLKKFRWPCI